MKYKKLVNLGLAAMMAASVMAGCGNASSGSSSATSGKSGSAAAADFDASGDITVVSREDGSGTRGAFVELTGVEEKDANGEKVDNTTEEAQVVNSTSVVLTTVAGDPYAIGYISLGSLNDTVKAVQVDGVDATEDNILAGKYTLSRPFNIATKGDPTNPVSKDFIGYILSEDGQKIVSDNGYIKQDPQDYTSTQPSGSITVGGSSSVSPLMEKLIEGYQKVNPNAKVELQTSDSTTGMTSTIDGSYDIGMASRELTNEETSKGLKNTVIATDGIAVIVNKANPIDNLTKDQIKGIYTGDTQTWDELEK